MKNNDSYSFVKVGDKPRALVSFSQLCEIGDGRKYTDILSCAKKYDTAKHNNHSKERLARKLFCRIVRVFIEMSIMRLVSGMTYKFPGRNFFSMRIILKCNTDKLTDIDFKNLLPAESNRVYHIQSTDDIQIIEEYNRNN